MSEAENVLLPAKFPHDWPISSVGAQFHIILGKMLDVEKNVGTRKPYLGNRSVQWGYIDVSDLDMIKLTDGDIRKYRLQRGDLLVCEGGDIGRAAIWQDQLEECYFQKALHRLRPRGDYSSVLMRYLLEYYAKTGFLVNFATQTSIAHLPKDKFVTVPLPLPPFLEQQAIATALSDADEVVAGLEHAIAKKRLIKQGAMQDLLTARRRLPGFSGEWEVKRLGSVLKMQVGFPFSSAFFSTRETGPRLVRNRDLRSNDDLMFYSGTFSDQFLLSNGDILIGMDGDFSPTIWSGGDALLNQRVGRLKAIAEIDLRFCYYLLQDKLKKVEAVTSGTTVKHLSHYDIEKIAVRVPEFGEQKAIAAVLSVMDAEIQTLESRLTKARAVKEGMMQNLLTGRVRLV